MNKKNKIIMSAASVSAALSAIATSSANHGILDAPLTTQYDAAALDILSTAHARSVLREMHPQIAKTIRVNDDLRRAAYAELAEGGGLQDIMPFLFPTEPAPGETFEVDGQTMSEDDYLQYQEIMLTTELRPAEGQSWAEFLDLMGGGTGVPDPTNPYDNPLTVVDDPGTSLMDSTSTGYFSCYNNCHSACHGSRGWR